MELLQFTNAHFNDLQISKLDWSIDRRDAKQNDFFKDPKYIANAKQNGFYKNNKPLLPTYKRNEYGFRSDEFFKTDSFIALGDSNTYGAYQYEERTWPFYLAESLGIKSFNLGVPGASIAQCYVILKKYISLIRPKYVFLLIPNLARSYTWLDDNYYGYNTESDSTFCTNSSLKKKYSKDTLLILDSIEIDSINSLEYQELNYYKYTDAIYNVCEEYGAKLVYLLNPSCPHRHYFRVEDMIVDDSYALDYRHFGHLYMKRISNYFFKNYDSKKNCEVYI